MMDQEKKTQQLDTRSQDRYTRKGELTPQEIQAHLDSLPDLAGQETGFAESQPAIGTFDAETLARIQKTFPYNR
jgi:hypothetical protein